jgi:hypothetical protein
VGDSMGMYFVQTLFHETNLTKEILNKTLVIKQYLTKKSEYIKIEYMTQQFLHAKSAAKLYKERKPGLAFFELGRWYLYDMLWPSPNTTLSIRLAVFQKELVRWALVTTQYLDSTPQSKVIWVVQDPIGNQKWIPGLGEKELNERFEQFNEVALSILSQFPEIWVWKTGRQILEQYKLLGLRTHLYDDTHTNDEVRKIQVQILANFLCNKYVTVAISENLCVCKSV